MRTSYSVCKNCGSVVKINYTGFLGLRKHISHLKTFPDGCTNDYTYCGETYIKDSTKPALSSTVGAHWREYDYSNLKRAEV